MQIDFRNWWCLVLGFALTGLLFWVYSWPLNLTGPLFAESGPFEIISAFAYAFAALVAAMGVVRARSPLRWYIVMWMLLCIVFFGEETSWLQHAIGYNTPEGVAELNAQAEFNLHNLHAL